MTVYVENLKECPGKRRKRKRRRRKEEKNPTRINKFSKVTEYKNQLYLHTLAKSNEKLTIILNTI